jgi:hypothetical protein
MEEWDPVRVAGISEAADEYDTYVGHVGRQLREGACADEIASYLTWAAEDRIGLGPPVTPGPTLTELSPSCLSGGTPRRWQRVPNQGRRGTPPGSHPPPSADRPWLEGARTSPVADSPLNDIVVKAR